MSYLIKQFKIKPNEIDFVAVANENVTNTNLWNIVNEFSVNDFYKLHTDYFYEYIYKDKLIQTTEFINKMTAANARSRYINACIRSNQSHCYICPQGRPADDSRRQQTCCQAEKE